MRMRIATEEDRAMARALANMRYASCTPEDLAFLQSRIVGNSPAAPRLSDALFRNVSIITARNSEKDAFNELGARRFAADTGQQLESFYSCDVRASEDTIRPKGKKKRKPKKVATAGSGITDELQQALWSSLPCFTGHVAGRLDLCKGMPVMIRSNIATELCMTKGQEAIVYGWSASRGAQKQRILDVLFVKLINPPHAVHIEGLEENVVPLSREKETVECQLPSDQIVKIERSQVPILPNFSMTDYASQGKTRPVNVVNLANSRSHQAFYTALSRSSSAAGTAILAAFNTRMITRGLDDQLRREFRNLEILNDITRLKYHGQLPEHVKGDTRNQLIRSYLDWKGPDFELSGLHPALRWQSREEWDDIDTPFGRQAWQFAENEDEDQKQEHKPASTIAIVERTSKRKVESTTFDDDRSRDQVDPAKKRARHEQGTADDRPAPKGYTWNASDWSCPYDSLFTVLHCIWLGNPARWTPYMSRLSPFMKELTFQWARYTRQESTLWSDTRDAVRKLLNSRDSILFPYGNNPASVVRLAMMMMGDKTLACRTLKCVRCNATRNEGTTVLAQCHPLYTTNLLNGRNRDRFTTADWLAEVLKGRGRAVRCLSCRSPTIPIVTVQSIPDILCLDRTDAPLVISHQVAFKNVPMKLRGIVYGGQNHFTCRAIDNVGTVYRHDGMFDGDLCVREGPLDQVPPDQLGCWRGRDGTTKKAVLVLYERESMVR
ncbi:hypothetical protein EV715DRAFT_214838 [Schizophyllum commune]